MTNKQIIAGLKARRDKRYEEKSELEIGLVREHDYELAEDILSHLGKKDWQSGGYPAISATSERAENMKSRGTPQSRKQKPEGMKTSAFWISSSRR